VKTQHVKVLVGIGLSLISVATLAMDAQITVHSIPEPGEVRINGVVRGKTPLLLSYPQKTIFKLTVTLEDKTAEIDYVVEGDDTVILDLASGAKVDMPAYKKYLASKVVQDQPTPVPTEPPTPVPTEPPPMEEVPVESPLTESQINEPVQSEIPSPANDLPDSAYPESNDKIKVDRPPEILQPPKLSAIPLEIQNLNLKGSMEFKLLVDVDGTVRKVTISKSSGNDQIDQFVVPFLQKSIWTPAMKAGTPIACWRKLSISFYTLACKFDFIDLY